MQEPCYTFWVQRILETSLIFLIFFGLLFAYTKLVGPIPFSVNSITTQKSTTFDVTGTGKASAKPDFATVEAGITAKGDNPQAVQDQINKVINAVSSSIKNLGIDSKDIQTSNYNVNPNYDYTGGSQKISGYSGNTNLRIRVKDISKVNSVIDAATAAGANQVNNLGFDITDKAAAENEARKLAVEDAKKKAQDAANIAGFKLGNIVNYSENFNGQPRPVSMLQNASAGVGGVPTQVEPGSNEITVTVTLSYEIR